MIWSFNLTFFGVYRWYYLEVVLDVKFGYVENVNLKSYFYL